MTEPPDFLRAGEIARLADVSVRTVMRWIAEETLPSVKVRGARLVPRKDLERVLSPPTPDWDNPEGESEGETDVEADMAAIARPANGEREQVAVRLQHEPRAAARGITSTGAHCLVAGALV
jgi:excisionase family DNA binding protein